MSKRTALKVLNGILDTDVSPLAYIVCVYFMIFSGGIIFFTDSDSVQNTVLARLGVPGGIGIWAFFLFGASGWTMLAMALKSKFLISVSSMIGFATQSVAAFTYYQGSQHLQGATSTAAAMMFVYFFIAGNVDRLWNYAPRRD